jgi:hypothetical protein
MVTFFCPTEKPAEPKFYGQSYAWTQWYPMIPIYIIYLFYSQYLPRFRYASSRSGIRPISPSSNILIRVNSHRIFSSSLHCSLLIEYYSMMVATRPDPTVRPPSRYQTGVLRCSNGDFSYDL